MGIDASALTFPAPRSPAACELNRLLDDRAEVLATIREAEYAGQVASEAAQVASAQLSALEARRLGGDDVDAEVKRAEKKLSAARAEAAQPWPERAAGARRALANADAAIGRFVVATYDALAGEVAEDAHAVKDRADALLHDIGAVYAERERVVARSDALIGVVARVKPGMTPYSKLEPLVRQAEAVLMAGGEAAPIPNHDPRVPQAGVIAEEFSA